nr:DUF3596 domain-containing protein [Pseudomonas oleovorans]
MTLPSTLAPIVDARQPSSPRLPQGVELRGNTLRICFFFEGERCREIVSRGRVDEFSIALADRLRGQVLNAIATGRFDYRVYFPDSRRARALHQAQDSSQQAQRSLLEMTVKEGVSLWLATQHSGKAKSTAASYASKAEHVINAFGELRLADVKTQDLQKFRNQLVRSRQNPNGLSPKTANDVLTVIRGVWKDAYDNGITSRNRADSLKNHRLEHESQADPFSLDEMQLLLNGAPHQRVIARMLVLNCWLGLSRSELVALAAEDVDLKRRKLTVSRAQVLGEHKAPKVLARQREIDLLAPAIELLEEILADTARHCMQPLEITRLDNLSVRYETVRLLFTNPNTGKPWSQSALDRWFKAHTKAVGVRYRGLNQCRHTFASRALSKFAPQEWVIKQLGHIDGQMLQFHYAKWIPEETGLPRNCVDAINEAMCSGWTAC